MKLKDSVRAKIQLELFTYYFSYIFAYNIMNNIFEYMKNDYKMYNENTFYGISTKVKTNK